MLVKDCGRLITKDWGAYVRKVLFLIISMQKNEIVIQVCSHPVETDKNKNRENY
jgi:hypothetical protein